MKVYGQLEKAQFENLASDPAVTALGYVYYNTTVNRFKVYNGTTFVDTTGDLATHTGASTGVHGVVGSVVGTSDSQALTNKTIDADLNTVSNIDDGNIKVGADIARSKLIAGTADHVIINNGSGVLSSEAQLSISRGGTGQSTQTAAFDALAPSTTKGDVIVHNGTDNVREAVGANNSFLVADSAQSSGVKWTATPQIHDFVSNSITFTMPTADGTSGQVLQTDGSGNFSWVSPLTNPMTTLGDIIVGGVAGAANRLPLGSNGSFLIVDTNETYDIGWTASSQFYLNTSNGRVGVGTTSPITKMTLSSNSGSPSPIPDGTGYTAYGSNGGRVGVQAFGFGGAPFYIGQRTGGTGDTPTDTTSGMVLLNVTGRGYNSGYTTQDSVGIIFKAADTWAVGSQPTSITFQTTPSASLTPADRMFIASDGKVGIGTISPTAPLSVNLNSSDSVPSTISPGINLFGANSVSSNIQNVSFNASGGFHGYRVNGTMASPAAVSSGETLTFLGSRGHDGTGYTTTSALVYLIASENWTGSAHGTNIRFDTASNGTISATPKMLISSEGLVGIGTTAPTSKLSVNLNTSSAVPTLTNGGITLFGADSSIANLQTLNFGVAAGVNVYRANGTMDSPTALLSGDQIGSFSARGYNGSAYTTGARSAIIMSASENWSGSANGSVMQFYTTANTTTAITERMRISDIGEILVTNVHNNGGNSGSVQAFSSGTYTPTASSPVNISSQTVYPLQWMRVGKVVTISGQIDITPTATSGAAYLRLTLPFTNGNFTQLYQGGGGGGVDNYTRHGYVTAIAQIGDNKVSVQIARPTSTASCPCYFSFTYLLM